MKTNGYTFVALVVGIAVMMVLIAAVLPLASTEAQRDKEDELIFRGFQYAEGVRLFRRRYGRYPNTLKEMYEMRPRTLRHLWKDPITNSMNWGLVSVLSGAPSTIGGRGPTPPGAPTPVPSPTPAPTPGFGAPPDASAGPIAGVYSKSKKKGFRQFNGRDTYDQWQFTEQTLMNQSGIPQGGPCAQTGKPGPGC